MKRPLPALKICVVTGQIVGPLGQGGIGTATTGLAKHLAAIGHQVTVLYTRGYQMSASQMKHWTAVYREDGIDFVPLAARSVGAVRGPLAALGFPAAAAVLDYLRARHYDIVHLNDLEGEGCLAIASRKCGIAFQNTAFVTGLHSPTKWIETLNKEPARHSVSVAMDAAEQFQIRNSDVLWSPSNYLLKWIQSRGFVLPAHAEVQQYVLPPLPEASTAADAANPRPKVTDLVFFGRMEERKGIFTFLDALDLIQDELKAQGVKVSFLGPHTSINGVHSADMIRRRSKAWSFDFKIIGGLPHRDALAYLAMPGRLAVMASPEDNSPCTIYEAMELGIPFIAASGGGIPELVNNANHASVLFEPDAPALASRLRQALAVTPPIPKPAFSQDDIRSQWRDHHNADGWVTHAQPPKEDGAAELAPLHILIEDTGSGAALARTIASLGAETQPLALILSKRTKISSGNLPVIAPEWLASHLSALGHPGLLCLNEGFEIDRQQFNHLRAAASRFPDSVLLPSAVLDGQPAASPPLSPALAYVHGPAPTGSILIGAALVKELSASQAAADGPFAGLADRAIAAAAQVIPYPAAIGSITRNAVARTRPLPSTQRLAHYKNLPPKVLIDIDAYVKIRIAAGQRWSGRKLWLRLIASPIGPLAPWILEAARLLRVTRR